MQIIGASMDLGRRIARQWRWRHGVGMTRLGLMAMGGLAVLPLAGVAAAQTAPGLAVGARYDVVRTVERAEESDGRSSGSSYDRDGLTVEVLAMRPEGVVLRYDLPRDTSADDRARQWMLPAEVLRPVHGDLQLLNADVLAERRERWLKAAGWSHEACGRWTFSWTAVHIECDPAAVLRMIGTFEPGPESVAPGAAVDDAEAVAPGILTRKDGPDLVAEMAINAEAVRREEAQSDVAVGEISQKPVTLEQAMAKRAGEAISGTITVMYARDGAGRVTRRERVARMVRVLANGKSESSTSTETIVWDWGAGRGG